MSDLLKRKDVIAAYKGLVNQSPGYCSHQQKTFCDQCGIPGSIADVAFAMTEAVALSGDREMGLAWMDAVESAGLYRVKCWVNVRPEHLIEAAAKAWEGRAK